MAFDQDADARHRRTSGDWMNTICSDKAKAAMTRLVETKLNVTVSHVSKPVSGAFHACIRMTLVQGYKVMLRFTGPGAGGLAEEKTKGEVAVLRYLAAKTDIPVPKVLAYGSQGESPLNLGPFVIMQYIDHTENLGQILEDIYAEMEQEPESDSDFDSDFEPLQDSYDELEPGSDPESGPDPRHEEKLKKLYKQFGAILLQLSRCEFPQIGALVEESSTQWVVGARPLSFNMELLTEYSDFPVADLPTRVHTDSRSYFKELAELHAKHLSIARIKGTRSAQRCRQKYAIRQLFLKLANSSEIGKEEFRNGPFKLWCDDLRPGNILVDSNCTIVGVIDLEFSYAAPVEFTYSPPWSLLGFRPEWFSKGVACWLDNYSSRFVTFRTALKEAEQEMISRGTLQPLQKLSTRMYNSWASKDFMLYYSVRQSFSLDKIFPECISDQFPHVFGSYLDTWEEIFAQLSPAQKEDMERLVARLSQESDAELLAV